MSADLYRKPDHLAAADGQRPALRVVHLGVRWIYGKDGICKALDKAKKDGLARFIGASGHNRPGRFLLALKEWKFDVMMNAVSLVSRHIYDFESKVWPHAAKKMAALVAMKVFGGAAKSGVAKGSRVPDDFFRDYRTPCVTFFHSACMCFWQSQTDRQDTVT